MRLFAGIDLEGEAREYVLAARQRLVETITRQGVRFVSPEKLHLTLTFFGYVEDSVVPNLVEALSEVRAAPFALTIGALGGFPDLHRPKVVWLGVAGAVQEAEQLANGFALAAIPHAPELDVKPYSPHITLARVSPGSKDVGRAVSRLEIDPLPGSLRVEDFYLFHSRPDGAYEKLHRFFLKS